MPLELTVTAKGQVTLRRELLRHLGIGPGDRIGVTLMPDGKVELTPAHTAPDIRTLRGALKRPGAPPVSLEAMQHAVEQDRPPCPRPWR
jgi:AbrB family looped-hinge helix DNA binding protein